MKILLEAFLARNFGDDLFVTLLCEHYREHEIYLLDTEDRSPGFSNSCKLSNITSIDPNEVWTRAGEFDVYIFVGGDFYPPDADYSWRTARIRLVQEHNGHVFILGGSLYRNYPESVLPAIQEFFELVDAVSFRDQTSLEQCRTLFPNARCYLSSDMAFSLCSEYPKREPVYSAKGDLGISVRKKWGGTPEQYHTYCNLMAQAAVLHLENSPENRVSFLALSTSDYDDRDTIDRIMSLIPNELHGRIRFLEYTRNIHQYIQQVDTCDALLCTRFHSLCLALILGKPFGVINYEAKIDNLLTDLDFQGLQIPYGADFPAKTLLDSLMTNRVDPEKLELYRRRGMEFFAVPDAFLDKEGLPIALEMAGSLLRKASLQRNHDARQITWLSDTLCDPQELVNRDLQIQMLNDTMRQLQAFENSFLYRLYSFPRKVFRKLRELFSPDYGTRIMALRSIAQKLHILSFLKLLIPKKLRSRFWAKASPASAAELPGISAEAFQANLENFLSGIRPEEKVWLVLSGVEYVDHEGQRNVRLVHEAMKKGVKVIYAYFRWSTSDPLKLPTEYMLPIPLDYLYDNRSTFFEQYLTGHTDKTLIAEFPHRHVDEIIPIANCFGWVTVYDVIDDWEAFCAKGQAVWYKREIEERVVTNVDINVATAAKLKEKMLSWTGFQGPYHVISNGVDIERIKPAPKQEEYNFCKGTLQIGYFGHLTDAWFDWPMLKELARRRPDWTFHIIGYGAPENLEVPDNIILYGKKKPDELAYYAAYWDVATIPFINCELTESVNPIKIYEYLRMGLPTVASYMPEIANAPYTQLAIGVDAFEAAILRAAEMTVEEQVAMDYLKENTWERKCDAIIQAVESFDPSTTYKQLI